MNTMYSFWVKMNIMYSFWVKKQLINFVVNKQLIKHHVYTKEIRLVILSKIHLLFGILVRWLCLLYDIIEQGFKFLELGLKVNLYIFLLRRVRIKLIIYTCSTENAAL